MGSIPSLLWEENEAHRPTEAIPARQDSVSIKLSCADFGIFNGRSDQWIAFKENTLSKAGVGGYAKYFKEGFVENPSNREGNNRIFYLLQTATNGGGASHVVRRYMSTADGHGAWLGLLAWYEGPVMSGEIAKTLRTKLWALRLRSKDDVNKHINDFTLYMDQLRELSREEREETLTDLFLDSIIDPMFEVTIANCRLRDHITIYECFEAIRKYDNIITRGDISGDDGGARQKIRRINTNNNNGRKVPGIEKEGGTQKMNGTYRTYSEWQKLTPEQRSEVIEAREKGKGAGPSNDIRDKGQETNRQQQRGRKRTRRVNFESDKDEIGTKSEEQS
jgi:hypothetical protein